MLSFILRRLVQAIGASAVMTLLIWLLTTSDGSHIIQHPVSVGSMPGLYAQWLNQLIHGNLGYSRLYRDTVANLLATRIPVTLAWIIPAFLLQEALAIMLGTLSGSRHRTSFDRLTTNTVAFFNAMPMFWFALNAIIIFGVYLRWFSFNGLVDLHVAGTFWNTPEYWQYFHANTLEAILDIARHLELPILLLAISGAATDTQLVRIAMIDVMSQEYIRAARARGISQHLIVWKHALRNTLLPLITSISIQLPALIFTASIIEYVFFIPGISTLFIRSFFRGERVTAIDHPVLSSYFLILGICTIIASLIADIAYASADPRLRRAID